MTKKYFLEYRAMIVSDLNLAYRGAVSNIKSEKSLGAYHMQQAIEKTIKLKVELLTGKVLWGHDIQRLIDSCDMSGIKIGIPPLIRRNANMYSSWEASCRYMPVKVVNKNSILAAYRVCLEWLNTGITKL